MTFHKMNKDFAIGFLIRRALLQQIITTRGPLICKKCNEPMDEQDITRHLNGYPTLLTGTIIDHLALLSREITHFIASVRLSADTLMT